MSHLQQGFQPDAAGFQVARHFESSYSPKAAGLEDRFRCSEDYKGWGYWTPDEADVHKEPWTLQPSQEPHTRNLQRKAGNSCGITRNAQRSLNLTSWFCASDSARQATKAAKKRLLDNYARGTSLGPPGQACVLAKDRAPEWAGRWT